MKKLLGLSLGVAGALIATQASAVPFSLGGYNGPIKIHFSNYESISDPQSGANCTALTVGCVDYGVLSIDQILTTGNQVLWNSGDKGAYLSGVFNGLTVDNVTASGSNFTATSTGDVRIDIYLNSSPLDASQGILGYANALSSFNSLQYHTVSDLGGDLFLQLQAVAGADAGGSTVTSTFTSQTSPFSGSALEYLNVLGGTGATTFDTNTLTTGTGLTADMLSQNTFCPNGEQSCGPLVGDWQLLSSDPIRANVVPEPESLALIGLGLLGMGLGYRMRGQRNA